MKGLELACAADEAYAPYCAAMLQAVLSQPASEPVTVHFLCTPDLPAAVRGDLQQLVESRGGRWHAIEIDPQRIAHLPRMARVPQIMWLRVMLPELLPDSERVLYVDVDTLAMEPLDALWETPLDDNLIAAVDNVLEPSMRAHVDGLGFATGQRYFNSGVLLMNLQAMRDDGSTQKLLDCARSDGEGFKWPDQDALNLVLGPRRKTLHPRWNCQNSLFYWRDWSVALFGETAVNEAVRRPAILHFEGPAWAKPWHYLSDHPFRDAWYRQQRASDWPPPPPLERNLKNMVLRHLPPRLSDRLRTLLGRRPRPLPQCGPQLK